MDQFVHQLFKHPKSTASFALGMNVGTPRSHHQRMCFFEGRSCWCFYWQAHGQSTTMPVKLILTTFSLVKWIDLTHPVTILVGCHKPLTLLSVCWSINQTEVVWFLVNVNTHVHKFGSTCLSEGIQIVSLQNFPLPVWDEICIWRPYFKKCYISAEAVKVLLDIHITSIST